MRLTLIACLTTAILLCSCQTKKSDSLQKSPETVVREWQHHVDSNHFQDAMKLSTEKTQQMLASYGSPFEGDTLQTETNFLSLSCKEDGLVAICKCTIKQEDSDEIYEDLFHLVKENGQWLVDLEGFDQGEEGVIRDSTAFNGN